MSEENTNKEMKSFIKAYARFYGIGVSCVILAVIISAVALAFWRAHSQPKRKGLPPPGYIIIPITNPPPKI